MKRILSMSLVIMIIFGNFVFANENVSLLENDKLDMHEKVEQYLKKIKKKEVPIVLEEASFEIEIPKVSIDLYIDSFEKKYRKDKSEKTKNLLSKETIEEIYRLYPELAKVDLTKWSYEKFRAYDLRETEKKYKPDAKIQKQLEERGIKLDDARRLKAEFGSYENLLLQEEKVLKKSLEKYYLGDLEAIANLVVEENVGADIKAEVAGFYPDPDDNSTTYTYLNGLKYYRCYLSGYKWDWFHVDSLTHRGDNNITYGARANVLWKKIYNTTTSYHSESMWGSYSNSMGWPHEAIDFDRYRGANVYPAFNSATSGSGNGEVTAEINTSYYGRLVYYCGSGYNRYTVSHQHLGNRNSGPFSYNDIIGEESGYGKNSDPEDFPGSHVHISVRRGEDTTWDVYDDKLDSDNIYSFVYYSIY